MHRWFLATLLLEMMMLFTTGPIDPNAGANASIRGGGVLVCDDGNDPQPPPPK